MGWRDFLGWWHETWRPGEHLSVIAPTGAGKTTFVGGILPLRRFVIAMDPKGGDSTLASIGFPRLTNWPPPKKAYEDMERGIPYRRVLGPANPRHDQEPGIRRMFGRALDDIYDDKNWTLYIPDLQLMTDARYFGHARKVDKQLIAARDRQVSVVTDYQAPRHVPRAAGDQATWVATSYTRDTDVVSRIAEMLGRPKPEVRGAVSAVEKHGWLVVGRDPTEPYRVTRPLPLARSGQAS